MSDGMITVPTGHGDVTLPVVQMLAVADRVDELRSQGKAPVWHPANCGCCIVVHEAGEHPPAGGFLVGDDGGYEWIDGIEGRR